MAKKDNDPLKSAVALAYSQTDAAAWLYRLERGEPVAAAPTLSALPAALDKR